MRKIDYVVSLFLFANAAQAQDMSDKAKAITGFTMQELKACHADDECALVPSFVDCCKQESINKSHEFDIENNRSALLNAMMTPEMRERCTMVECQAPRAKAVCRENACSSEALP